MCIRDRDGTYADNHGKLRFLENHDQTRAKAKFPHDSDLINWTAFLYFQKGATLLYGGQETENDVTPSLFDEDKVDWNTGKCLTPLMRKLYEIKKLPVMLTGAYELDTDDAEETIIGRYCSTCLLYTSHCRTGEPCTLPERKKGMKG